MKIFESKRYILNDCEIAYQVGYTAHCNRNLDDAIENIQSSLDEDSDVLSKKAIKQRKQKMEEAIETKKDNLVRLYDNIREKIGIENSIIMNKCGENGVEVIEFDTDVKFKEVKLDNNDKFYIEVEE